MMKVEILFPRCASLAIIMIFLWMLLILHQEAWLRSGGVVAPSLGPRLAHVSVVSLTPGRESPVVETQGMRIEPQRTPINTQRNCSETASRHSEDAAKRHQWTLNVQ